MTDDPVAGSAPGDGVPEVDARGQQCPYPVLQVAAWAKTAELGAEVVVLSDDAASKTDVPAWARLTGNTVVQVMDRSGHVAFWVRRTAR